MATDRRESEDYELGYQNTLVSINYMFLFSYQNSMKLKVQKIGNL